MRFTFSASPLLILATAAAALTSGQVHLERRTSSEVRPSAGAKQADYPVAVPYQGNEQDYSYGKGGRPAVDPYQRRYPARRRPYGGKAPQSAYGSYGLKDTAYEQEEDCDEKDVLPASTTTCTDDFPEPTHVPVYGGGASEDSGVQNSGEQACEAVTVTQTEQIAVPEYITETVTETVDRPVTMTETVEVTSTQLETTTLVQPVYQTETVTCTETLPPVYETKYETVEHTVYQTATETVYPQPTGGVDTSGEQRYPVEKPASAYPETPSAYPEAKASAY